RLDGKVQCVAGFIPYAAVIAGDHAEAVATRFEIRILHLAIVDHLNPVRVLALQLVTETDLLWRDEAQRRVIDPDVADPGGQAQSTRGTVLFAIGGDLFNVYGRRQLVERKMA